MSIGIVIATHGHEAWEALAWKRAWPSAHEQVHEGDRVKCAHYPEGTLAGARNAAADGFTEEIEWLCFLDADDELAPGYIRAMRYAIANNDRPERALLIPRVQYVRARRREQPRFPAHRPGADLTSLRDGNWLVIGTLIQRAVFEEIGGFEEWPMYEDWALFARAWKAGAKMVEVPEAVYIAHRSARSRNHAGGRRAMIAAHNAIRRSVFPELYEEGEMTKAARGYDS